MRQLSRMAASKPALRRIQSQLSHRLSDGGPVIRPMCVDDEKLEARDEFDEGVFHPNRLPSTDCGHGTTYQHGRQIFSFWDSEGGALDSVRLALVVRNQFVAAPNLERAETSVALIGCDGSRHGLRWSFVHPERCWVHRKDSSPEVTLSCEIGWHRCAALV